MKVRYGCDGFADMLIKITAKLLFKKTVSLCFAYVKWCWCVIIGCNKMMILLLLFLLLFCLLIFFLDCFSLWTAFYHIWFHVGIIQLGIMHHWRYVVLWCITR